jgi:hypothetical protein
MATPSTPPENTGQVTGQAPLYIKPEALNPEQHGTLGLKQATNPYSFAKNQHFVPLLAPEIPSAATSFPVIFAGEENTPLAVMGLMGGENIFFDENGVLRNDIYLPAYMRRYPFTTALEESGERMVICIDRGSDLIGEKPDLPFFEKGELSQYSKDCIKFCEDFEADRGRTVQFVKHLKDLDLFEHREATFQPPPNADGTTNPPQVVAGFNAISDAKLFALPDDKFIELKNLGYLHVIYAHMQSQMHWDRLIAMTLTRRSSEAAAADTSGKKVN